MSKDFGAGCGVEIPGRLVRKDERGIVDERPGDRHTLLLTARQLAAAGSASDATSPTASRGRSRARVGIVRLASPHRAAEA